MFPLKSGHILRPRVITALVCNKESVFFLIKVFIASNISTQEKMGIFMLRLMLGHWNSGVLRDAWNSFFGKSELLQKIFFYLMILCAAKLEGALTEPWMY